MSNSPPEPAEREEVEWDIEIGGYILRPHGALFRYMGKSHRDLPFDQWPILNEHTMEGTIARQLIRAVRTLTAEVERLKGKTETQNNMLKICHNKVRVQGAEIERLKKVVEERGWTLRQMQEEQRPWVKHNFGDRPSWMPLLGAVEELGELAHAFLKEAQGIRTSEDHTEQAKDAVADIVIFLADFCSAEGYDLEALVMDTWEQVKQRDWKADSAAALAERSE